MSIKVMTQVWERLNLSGGDLGMALALADIADDDGTKIYPSVNKLCWKTRQSRRAVQRQLRRLQEIGLLILVKKCAGGRYKSAEYRICSDWINGANLARLPDREPFDREIDYGVIGDKKPRLSRRETAPPVAPNSSGSIHTHHSGSEFADGGSLGAAKRRMRATVNGLSASKRFRP